MDEEQFYEEDVDIEFDGNFDLTVLLSDDEEEEQPIHENCNCNEICSNPFECNNEEEKEEAFNIRQNYNIASIVEKHESYLIRLKETDKRLRPILPLQLLNYPCKCGQRCDALLSIYEICQMRMNWPLFYRDRIAAQFYILKTLMVGKEFSPFIKGYRVCINFFCAVNIIPIGRVHRFVELINAGINNPVHPNTGKRFERQTTIEKLARLALYIDENFDSNPARNSYLPSSKITKCTAAGEALNIPVKERRKQNFTKLFKKLACNTHFISGNDLTKCNICSEYSFAFRKTSLTPAEKAKIQLDWEEHKIKIRNDRRDYKFRCLLSLERPFKYCSIIHDGMCKMKTKLPLNNDHRSKKIVDNERMFCGLNLAIMHRKNGINNTTTVGFFSPGSCYDNTTNAIISQILYSLSILPEIPPTVFIQIDNFPGNKSYIFNAAFAYILLRQKSIREFYISFMLPGHTHCDVDARFGNFSSYLNAKECGSPQELISAFVDCIPGETQMKQIENARFELSETLLCGQRQKEDSMISKIFKKIPPLDLQFQLALPEMAGIESMLPHIPKWEKVISATAKNDLLHLKEEIETHIGIPFASLLQIIQEKGVALENLQIHENTTAADTEEAEEAPMIPVAIINPTEQTPVAATTHRRSSRLAAVHSPAQISSTSRKRKANDASIPSEKA